MTDATTERLLERSEAAVARERESRIAHIRGVLSGEGTAECVDCGQDIDPKRRQALPSAKTCVRCQTFRERESRR